MPFWRGLREQCFGTRKKAAHKEKWRSVDPEFKLPWARYQSCILALLIEKGVIRLQFSVLIVTLNTVLNREHGLPSVWQRLKREELFQGSKIFYLVQ